jgi:hypothetical protein
MLDKMLLRTVGMSAVFVTRNARPGRLLVILNTRKFNLESSKLVHVNEHTT